MKLIVGLGNPGEKYRNSRHNVGFMTVEYIGERLEVGSWKLDKKGEAEMLKGKLNEEEIILAKPQTFMNESGKSVRLLTTNYQLPTTNLIVIHDDLDIKLGEYKIQSGKGPKLHNGIESIEKALGTKEFLRIRIGVDNRSAENRVPGEAYVLQDFTKEEKEVLLKVFSSIFTYLSNC